MRGREGEEEGRGGRGVMNCSEDTASGLGRENISSIPALICTLYCVYSDSLEEAHQFHLAKKRKKEEMLSEEQEKLEKME